MQIKQPNINTEIHKYKQQTNNNNNTENKRKIFTVLNGVLKRYVCSLNAVVTQCS